MVAAMWASVLVAALEDHQQQEEEEGEGVADKALLHLMASCGPCTTRGHHQSQTKPTCTLSMHPCAHGVLGWCAWQVTRRGSSASCLKQTWAESSRRCTSWRPACSRNR